MTTGTTGLANNLLTGHDLTYNEVSVSCNVESPSTTFKWVKEFYNILLFSLVLSSHTACQHGQN